ncbi:MAG: UbiH/UbiF/VisC/COQ6 family ubiquinone biosynthesis hydroxylase [Gammaproteobacteria bacterium]|nr:UbiH/UbiF/VisC/COQ6 family ubiquinone biosynthesis hydroxylase [Gammaproteobacteria bacterium]
MTTNTNTTEFDVIIVGGGIVGALFANILANSRLSVAIIDKHRPVATWDKQHVDIRVSAITRATQNILASLGVWDTIKKMRISAFREMHVWDSAGHGIIHFDSAELGEPCLGHIIENNVILSALITRLQQFDNIALFFEHRPSQLSSDGQRTQLQLENQKTLTGKLIIGADGPNSWVRQAAGITVNSKDYQQTAVVTTVKTEKCHQETAWQRFMPTGPLAFLPLSNGYSSIVWSTTPEHAQALLKMATQDFQLTLADAFEHKLGAILTAGKLASFPLKSQHANCYVKPRIALMGDAAHTVHPLAGQGLNLGFADAATLAEVLLDCTNLHNPRTAETTRDIGDYQVLRRYERWRKGNNLAMLTTMAAFKTLFGSQQTLLCNLRNIGLNLMDNITPAKNLILRHAMGLAGDLPKLAKRESLI